MVGVAIWLGAEFLGKVLKNLDHFAHCDRDLLGFGDTPDRSHWGCGHAGGGFHAEQLFGMGGGGGRFRTEKRFADHYRSLGGQ